MTMVPGMFVESLPIVLDCVIYVPHSVLHILNTSTPWYMAVELFRLWGSPPFQSHHFFKALTCFKFCFSSSFYWWHWLEDCIATIETNTSPGPGYLQTPLANCDMILNTDISACRLSYNKHLAWYETVNDWEVVEARRYLMLLLKQQNCMFSQEFAF